MPRLLVVLLIVLPATALSQIKDNTWMKLATTALGPGGSSQMYIATDQETCNVLVNYHSPIARVRTGWVPGDGKFFVMGGGQNYPGNDVELFDPTGNTWAQQYAPECMPMCCSTCTGSCHSCCDPACCVMGGSGTTELTPLGRPYTEHLYNRYVWHPVDQKFYVGATSGLWTWNPSPASWNSGEQATSGWTLLNTAIPQTGDIGNKTLIYDPDLNSIFWMTAAGPNSPVYIYNPPPVNTFTIYDHDPSGVPGFVEIYTAYSPVMHRHLVIFQTSGWWFWDAVHKSWTPLSGAPAETEHQSSPAYDLTNHLYLVAANRDYSGPTGSGAPIDVWQLSEDGSTWTGPLSLGTAPAQTFFGARFGAFKYDPGTSRFYLWNQLTGGIPSASLHQDNETEVWTLKYVPGGAASGCAGDCNGDHQVTIDELLVGVDIALGNATSAACPAFDADGNGKVTIDEIIGATIDGLGGCPGF